MKFLTCQSMIALGISSFFSSRVQIKFPKWQSKCVNKGKEPKNSEILKKNNLIWIY